MNIFGRYLMLLAGIAAHTFGIALMTTADLGTTPISTLPYVLSEIFGVSLGLAVFVFNMPFIAAQIAILKKANWRIFMQIPNIMVFSFLIDLGMKAASMIPHEGLAAQSFMSLSANAVIAVGILLQIKSDTLLQPVEGFIYAVAMKSKIAFGSLKIAVDSSCVVIAAILGLLVLNELFGVGIMTFVSAWLAGTLVKFFTPFFKLSKR